MSISFKCKCGAPLKASEDQAGQKLQCPTCGRVVVVPAPPPVSAAAGETAAWQIDISSDAVIQAEKAGIIHRGRAGVIRLHSTSILARDLSLEGVFSCWHCRMENHFSGTIFGRRGLGGMLVNVSCRKCNAGICVGFSSLVAPQGTNVFLWAPSHTRDYEFSEDEPLPAPSFRITAVKEVAVPKSSDVHTFLPALIQSVQTKVPYKELSSLAASIVALHYPEAHREVVCKAMRLLLEKDQPTYIKTVLVEALACLRDEAADEMVEYALQQSLAEEDPADPTNMPLHDLCVLALLFGDKSGFKNALDLGFKKLQITTRAFCLDKRLTPEELADLIKSNASLDSYESTLGGSHWQRIFPLHFLKEDTRKDFGPRWLKKWFRK